MSSMTKAAGPRRGTCGWRVGHWFTELLFRGIGRRRSDRAVLGPALRSTLRSARGRAVASAVRGRAEALASLALALALPLAFMRSHVVAAALVVLVSRRRALLVALRATLREHRSQLDLVDLAVAVPVQFLQAFRCLGDLIGGNDAVLVLVQRGQQGGDGLVGRKLGTHVALLVVVVGLGRSLGRALVLGPEGGREGDREQAGQDQFVSQGFGWVGFDQVLASFGDGSSIQDESTRGL